MYKTLFIFLLLTNFSFAQKRNKTIDSLVVKSLINANDTTDVFNVKNILNKRYNLYKDYFLSIPSINPLNPRKINRFSDKFGKRFHPIDNKIKAHLGLDISSKQGTPIHAAADGIIEKVITSNVGYGNQVIIKHNFGFTTRYAHMHTFIVKKGEVIKKGKIIGFVGSTGKSTGPHLHFEILKNNRHIDPFPFCFLDI